VIAGAGSNSTGQALELSRDAEAAGADAVLSVTPYYNKPTPVGLIQHYRAIASSVPLPIVVYSIQGRTGINVEPATLKRLAEIENIVGVKEASGNIGQMAAIVHHLPERFIVLSGDDAITIPLIALGGRGVISVVSNEIPAEFGRLTQLALAGDYAGARALQRHWFPLMEVNFCEANPGPVKAAMAMMGLLEPVWRLPMVPPSEANRAKVEAVLKLTGLLATSRSTHAD
jgi:4-hydroxy-tetrahydrodipicolinate synthase